MIKHSFQPLSFFCRRSIFSTSSKVIKHARVCDHFDLELGGSLDGVNVAYEEWGNPDSDDVVLLFPSFSVGSHARSSIADPTP